MTLPEALRENGFKPVTVTCPAYPPGHSLTVFAVERDGEMWVDDFCVYDFDGSGLSSPGSLCAVAQFYRDDWALYGG